MIFGVNLRRGVRLLLCIAWILIGLTPLIQIAIDIARTTIDTAIGISDTAEELAGLWRIIWDRLRTGLWVAVLTTIGTIGLGVITGYSLSRLGDSATRWYFGITVLVCVTPPVVLIVAYENILTQIALWHRFDTLVIVLIAIHLPLASWMLRGVFDHVPKSLDEAGAIDGCDRISTLFRLILPGASTQVISVGIFIFVLVLADYQFSARLLDPMYYTLTAVAGEIGRAETGGAARATLIYGATILPSVLLVIIFRRHLFQAAYFAIPTTSNRISIRMFSDDSDE